MTTHYNGKFNALSDLQEGQQFMRGETGRRTPLGHIANQHWQRSVHIGMMLEKVMQAGFDHVPHPV